MATKKSEKQDVRPKIIESALALAAERGWDIVTLRDIAGHCGISLAEMFSHFEDKDDILVAFGKMMDRRVLEGAGKVDDEASARDRLFDILMDRYDILNEYRVGLVAVLESFKCDPKQAVISMPHLCKSMNWMLEAAGVKTNGIRGAVKVAGLTGVYLKVLSVWAEDESPDLSKTMAALDKALGRAEKIATNFGL